MTKLVYDPMFLASLMICSVCFLLCLVCECVCEWQFVCVYVWLGPHVSMESNAYLSDRLYACMIGLVWLFEGYVCIGLAKKFFRFLLLNGTENSKKIFWPTQYMCLYICKKVLCVYVRCACAHCVCVWVYVIHHVFTNIRLCVYTRSSVVCPNQHALLPKYQFAIGKHS